MSLTLFLLIALSGCMAIPLGTLLPVAGTAYNGYVVWKRGEASKYYAYDLEATYRAVMETSRQLKIEPRVITAQPAAFYSLETQGSVPMHIDVTPYEKSLTKVIVKISPFGDRDYVEFFYRLVEEHLADRAVGSKEKSSGKPPEMRKSAPLSRSTRAGQRPV